MDRLTGAAPAYRVWKTRILLLNHRRKAHHALEDFVPLAYTCWLSVWRPGIKVGEAPSFPDGTSPSDLLFVVPAQLSTRCVSAHRSFLAQGPGHGRWLPESVDHAHRPSRVGGYNKKAPASFRARGLQFFSGSTSSHHRPRACSFDGSIPGGLVARRLGIRTCEQRPSPPL
jgi:hypothetical protein